MLHRIAGQSGTSTCIITATAPNRPLWLSGMDAISTAATCMEIFSSRWKKRLITEEEIDRSVTRLMMTRMKLGMFDKRRMYLIQRYPMKVNDCQEHRDLAKEVA